MLKTVKKWKWDSGRPPPLFFKIPTFSRFFGGGNVPYHHYQYSSNLSMRGRIYLRLNCALCFQKFEIFD